MENSDFFEDFPAILLFNLFPFSLLADCALQGTSRVQGNPFRLHDNSIALQSNSRPVENIFLNVFFSFIFDNFNVQMIFHFHRNRMNIQEAKT